ncbi:MAG: hypothetical protein ACR2JU_10595 [Nocardioidaceae bacterium]
METGIGPRCGGRHPGQYISGIDFVCDGSASASSHRHDREILGRFRHSTCEKFAGYDDRQWWMKPLKSDLTIPEDLGPDGKGGRLIRLDCTRCTIDHQMRVDRIDALMSEIWREHARDVERRNVSTLLN